MRWPDPLPAGTTPRSRRYLLMAGAALALTGCTSAAAGGADRPSGTGGSAGASPESPAGTGGITTIPAGRRPTAPDIFGKSLDGEPLRLSDYRGSVVLLNVWGSWCDPCKAEAPHLARAFEKTRDRGVQFLGINTRDMSTGPAKDFERRYGITYPSFYDPRGELVLRFKGHLLAQAIPSTVVMDRQGRIAARAPRVLNERDILGMLNPLIAEGR
ncbi:TlpA disulfide reductase family protein [Streptomyces halobius]|uniref:TlpA family protein disulfide reductase n=1 Tax=Streptomyces halobius TaxID=2879846 RepID=A0ABY4M2P9_9ACTN|nr:TlpA disulfide reductase family protein [Streptomyces halobius]UQA91139.1 TlpA family protein disulfide reductase [Streptomyces halobius]